jgi:fumarate reductase subunit C
MIWLYIGLSAYCIIGATLASINIMQGLRKNEKYSAFFLIVAWLFFTLCWFIIVLVYGVIAFARDKDPWT